MSGFSLSICMFWLFLLQNDECDTLTSLQFALKSDVRYNYFTEMPQQSLNTSWKNEPIITYCIQHCIHT